MASWKVAPAIAASNSVVLKSASLTPLNALALADVAQEAGHEPPRPGILASGSGNYIPIPYSAQSCATRGEASAVVMPGSSAKIFCTSRKYCSSPAGANT